MKHYAISGVDDPALLKTACGWAPKDLRPLALQPALAVEHYREQITRDLFGFDCRLCRIALKRGKHVN